MRLTLDTGVPLRIMEMERNGGPTDYDIDFARQYATVLGEKGDILQYGGKKGECAGLMNGMIRAVAVLAFCPGGVRLFGSHYEGRCNMAKGKTETGNAWDDCTTDEKLDRLRAELRRTRRDGVETARLLARHRHTEDGAAVEPIDAIPTKVNDPLA